MHAHPSDRTPAGQESRRTPSRSLAGTPGPGRASHSLLALQAAAGNAAVVQMLRAAGHPGAREGHQHGAGCGHLPDEPAQVQRSTVSNVLRRGGRPLDDDTRHEMESRLGADFSDVRVHSDSAARASAAELGARAYTSGSHVVIGAGGGDKHTLAHELTHVIQQRNGPVSGSDTGQGFAVSDPGDRFERAAEANAQKVMSGPVPDVQRLPGSGPGATTGTVGAAGLDAVQRASTSTLESAVVTSYHPTKPNAQPAQNLTVQRPKTVTGPIAPTGTAGRAAAPNPIAVRELQKSYKSQMGARGAPSEPEVWKDLFGGAGYDRGHVMGLEVGGSDKRENIVPQWSLNQGTGMWRRIEQALVGVSSGNLRFEVSYRTDRGNHRWVMIPSKIDIFLNNATYDSWENEPDVNDLMRAGRDPSDAAEYYKEAKEGLNGQTTLSESQMQDFALAALSHDKATFLAYQDYEGSRAQGLSPGAGASTADTHMQGMTRSSFPKERRDKLISSYIDAGWVTKSGTGAAATYTLHDVQVPVFDSDTDTGSSSDSDVDMSDGSQPAPGQPFLTMRFDSQGSGSDSDYDDAMSTGS